MSKYSKEFKEEALKLSDEIGLKKAAQQLGLPVLHALRTGVQSEMPLPKLRSI